MVKPLAQHLDLNNAVEHAPTQLFEYSCALVFIHLAMDLGSVNSAFLVK